MEALSHEYLTSEECGETTMRALLDMTDRGEIEAVKRVIAEFNLGELMFPLVRAIEYIDTRDRALIEKLTPEMRGIVELCCLRLGCDPNMR